MKVLALFSALLVTAPMVLGQNASQNATFVAQEIAMISPCGVSSFFSPLIEIPEMRRCLIRATAELFVVYDTRSRLFSREYYMPVLESETRYHHIDMHDGELHFARDPMYVSAD